MSEFFEEVHFLKTLQYNFFSTSQIISGGKLHIHLLLIDLCELASENAPTAQLFFKLLIAKCSCVLWFYRDGEIRIVLSALSEILSLLAFIYTYLRFHSKESL